MERQFKTSGDVLLLKKAGEPHFTEEIEDGLLGGLLHSPHYIYDVADTISPKMFHMPNNRKIYEAILEMHTEGENLDSTLLAKKTGVSRSHIAHLLESQITGANIKKYTKELQAAYIDLMLLDSADSIQRLAVNTKLSAAEKVERSERLLFDATALTDNRKYSTLKDTLKSTVAKLESDSPKEMGVTSGFKEIDRKLYGFHKSDLIILAARPSVGKTTLALDFARHAAKSGVPVGVFSLEMSEQQLGERMLAGESMVDAWKIRTSSVAATADKESIVRAIETLSACPIFIDDNASSTMANIRSSARRMKKQEKIGLIIIDYLQLISPADPKASTTAQITEISRSLKILAKELDIPVVALSQLSRAVEARGGTPRLSDLRDSGSIEQDADIVMFIHREDRVGDRSNKEVTGMAEILIEKHRGGAVGRVSLVFNEDKTTFQDAEFAGNFDEF